MGLSVSSLVSSLSALLNWSKDKDVRILMLGLDSAGKVSRRRCELMPPVLTSGLPRRTDNNIIQIAGNGPYFPCFIRSNGSTLKIGEVVSTIPSEQITTPAIILGSAEADQKFLLAIGFNVETVQVSFPLYAGFVFSGLHRNCQYKNIKFQVWDLGGQSSIR